MKNVRKLFALALALMLVMSLATTAFAAVVNNTSGHTYDAYQIFKGTQADNSTALGDVDWGTGVSSGANLLAALKADKRFGEGSANKFYSCTTAKQVAEVLDDDSTYNNDVAKAFANVAAQYLSSTKTTVTSTAELADGYYLLIDTTNVSGANDARNSALLQVTGDDITINKKYTVPSVDKDITKAGTTTYVNGIEGADAAFGDDIEFTLTGTLPSNYADYETYKYVFHDTLSAGLTYNGDAKVYIGSASGTEITSNFTISPDEAQTTGGGTLTITCTDLKAITSLTADSKIVVVYTAELNKNANVGSAGNSNKVYIEYSNDPDQNESGTPPTGKTPEDEVLVFTYELDVTKTDGKTDAKLANAEFVLLNADKNKVATVVNGELTGWVAVPNAGTDGKITWPANTTLTSGSDGKFIIEGLDADTVYYLRETKAPAGYNLLTTDTKVKITAKLNAVEGDETKEGSLTELKISINDGTATDGTISTGIVEAEIENNQGGTLPETGGVGTTMFYLIGGAMVLAAVILLVTKKRMVSAE